MIMPGIANPLALFRGDMATKPPRHSKTIKVNADNLRVNSGAWVESGQDSGSRDGATSRVATVPRSDLRGFDRHAFAGIPAGNLDAAEDRRLIGILTGEDAAAAHGLAALRPDQAKRVEPPSGAARDINRGGEAENMAGDRLADRLAGLGPGEILATQPGVERHRVVMPAVAPQHNVTAGAARRFPGQNRAPWGNDRQQNRQAAERDCPHPPGA